MVLAELIEALRSLAQNATVRHGFGCTLGKRKEHHG